MSRSRYAVRVCTTGYDAFFEDAERRRKLGQRQVKRRCGFWHWKNEKCEHKAK